MSKVTTPIWTWSVLCLTLGLATSLHAQSLPADLVPVPPADVPSLGHNFYSVQKLFAWPPTPFNWLSASNVQLYVSPSWGTNAIFVDDRDIDYVQQAAEAQVLRQATRAANDGPPVPGEGGGGGGTGGGSGSGWSGTPYATNEFWLEPAEVKDERRH